jgi:hypothetical protein
VAVINAGRRRGVRGRRGGGVDHKREASPQQLRSTSDLPHHRGDTDAVVRMVVGTQGLHHRPPGWHHHGSSPISFDEATRDLLTVSLVLCACSCGAWIQRTRRPSCPHSPLDNTAGALPSPHFCLLGTLLSCTPRSHARTRERSR